MTAVFGTIKRVKVPRDSKAGLSQLKALEEFAAKLKVGHIVAMPNSERQLEGAYWLALIVELPRVALQREIKAGDMFEAGWLVVKVQWYHYEPTQNRGALRAYRLKEAKVTIAVNPLLRILGISFEVGAAGPGGLRSLRSGADSIKLLGGDTHNSILNCIAD